MRTIIIFIIAFFISISSYSASVELTWKIKDDTNVSGYSVTMWLESGLVVTTKIGKVTSFKVNTLTEGKKYVFQITPLTKDGVSGPASNYVVYNVPVIKPLEISGKPELRVRSSKE